MPQLGLRIVSYRKASERVADLRTRFTKEADSMTKTANKRMSLWATEGEKMVNKLSDAKVVDDIASRVDFDQVSTQVNKLRDQLEDLLATWRSSFRPEKLPTVKVEASSEGVKFQTIPAKKTAAKKAAAKKTGGQEGHDGQEGHHRQGDRQEDWCQEDDRCQGVGHQGHAAKRPPPRAQPAVKKATAAKKVAVNA